MLAPLSPLASYWRFQRAVAKAQLAAWLPARSRVIIDISPHTSSAVQAAACGHTVLHIAQTAVTRKWRGGPGSVTSIVADPASLACLADGCADGVIAEDGALSRSLMTEDLTAEITRVLRPGGTLFACVDSLVLGMATLAEQCRWAHLTDLPNAEVVLIPWPDGTITRSFGASQFRDLLTEAGLDVRWIRPRTVLSPSIIDHVLSREPAAIPRLVRAELAAEQDGPPDPDIGISLLACASKPSSMPAAVPLGLALHTTGRFGPSIEPPLRNG